MWRGGSFQAPDLHGARIVFGVLDGIESIVVCARRESTGIQCTTCARTLCLVLFLSFQSLGGGGARHTPASRGDTSSRLVPLECLHIDIPGTLASFFFKGCCPTHADQRTLMCCTSELPVCFPLCLKVGRLPGQARRGTWVIGSLVNGYSPERQELYGADGIGPPAEVPWLPTYH
jgi:hypothetical protein